MTHTYEILGIGAPLVDRIIRVPDAFLNDMLGPKGGAKVVDHSVIQKILKEQGDIPIIAGGSGSNTITGLTHLGRKCALIGKIGNDEEGRMFVKKITSLGIVPLYAYCDIPTTQVLCLITPDGERTMLSFLGASTQMKAEDLDPKNFEGIKLVHIEGHSLFSESLTQRAMELAKEAGAKVSFDLASFQIVNEHKETIVRLLSSYVDVVFANIYETEALTQLPPQQGCCFLRDLCNDIAVVLMGAQGCWVGHREEIIYCPAFETAPLDTTGAGDLFSSGFLHGYLSKHPLEKCAHYGSIAGASVVQVIGAELPSETWEDIRSKL